MSIFIKRSELTFMLAVATRLIVSLPPSLPPPPPIQTATLSSDNLLRYITNRLNANKYSRDRNLFHLTLFRLLVLADAQMSRWVKTVEYSKGIPSGYSSFFLLPPPFPLIRSSPHFQSECLQQAIRQLNNG